MKRATKKTKAAMKRTAKKTVAKRSVKRASKTAVRKSAKKTPSAPKAASKKTATATAAKKRGRKPAEKATAKAVETKTAAATPSAAAQNPTESIGGIMSKTMNKYFSRFAAACIVLLAVAATVVAGCKSVPTVEKMTSTAKSVGAAAALACNLAHVGQTEKDAVVAIMEKVDQCVPTNSQTFAEAWMPIADEYVQSLVAQGKLDNTKAAIIITVSKTACKGVDYIFDVKYPKAREYQELVSAAVHGFTGGFLAGIAPTRLLSASGSAEGGIEVDKAAYEYLKSTL